MTDANRQDPKDKKADANQHEPIGERPDADQQEPAGAQLDEEQRDFLAKPDAKWQGPHGEKPDADQQEPAGVQSDEEQRDFLAKPDAKWQGPHGEKPDADQQEPAEVQSDEEQRDFLAKLDARWQDSLGAKPDADRDEPIDEKPDADQEEPAGMQLDEEQRDFLAKLDAKWQDPLGAKPDADRQEPVGMQLNEEQRDFLSKLDADRQEPISAKPDADQQEHVVEFLRAIEPPKPKAGPIFLIAAIVVGVGILCGIAIAFITWHEAKSTPTPGSIVALQQSLPRETRDLGSVVSRSVGLQGHLITKWDDKLEYNLVIEPSDPARIAGFTHAVSDPPRPLSIVVELKNFAGNVLCRQDIVLKYDARKAAALAAARAQSLAGKRQGRKATGEQDNQAADFDKLDAQEADRERGKDIFQNQTGPDGQIESIRSQGEIPCPVIAYGSVAYWSFTSNFPAVDEQDELLQRRANVPPPSSNAPAAGKGAKMNATSPSSKTPAIGKGAKSNAASPSSTTPATGKEAKQSAEERPAYLSIEGEDAIVGYDAATGVIETGSGKTFLIDKSSGEADAIRGRDFPINIHYKCDQTTADCILSHAGAVLLHAKMRK
jgi:hypothetical protein